MAAHEPPPLVTPSRHDPRIMLMAGVAGACLLGAAAGAWVKPEARDLKRREAPQVALRQTPAAEPEMQIVLDEMALPPSTTPLEVMRDRPPVLVKAVAPALRAAEPKKEPQPEPKKPAPAKPAKPKPKVEKIVVAKAEPKATPKPAKPEPAAKKAKPVLLAKAEAKPRPAPKVETPKPTPKPVVMAKVEPKPAAAPPAPPPPKKTLAKAVGRPAPVENTWAAEDRRLARAYRQALEAGAPEWRLARQQARWRSIRDEAMREAPWALSDIYAARIAELDDEAGEAAMQLD